MIRTFQIWALSENLVQNVRVAWLAAVKMQKFPWTKITYFLQRSLAQPFFLKPKPREYHTPTRPISLKQVQALAFYQGKRLDINQRA